MVTVLDRLSLPGSPARPNEDSCGAAGDWAWVIDGSIPLGAPPLMAEDSDAAWLVRFAGRRFAALSPGITDGRALIAQVIEEAREAFFAAGREAGREPAAWPGGAVTLVRAADGRIDAWTLADTVALLRRPDGSVRPLNDAPAMRAFESAAAAEMLALTGTDPESVRATPEFRAWMERPSRRPDGAVQSFGLRPEALARLRHEAAAAEPGSVLLLASDGFAALSDLYGVTDDAGLVEAALTGGLSALGTELRRVETEVDPSGRLYPRFKRSDDATALLLRIG